MLYIMRHGRTPWNELKKLQGRTDIPLSEEGHSMALRAGGDYADVHFDICYCSPLLRARETAELVLKGRSVPIVTDERLCEMSFGEFEGCCRYFEDPTLPIAPLFQDPARYTGSIGGAESFEALFARTGEFLEDTALPLVSKGQDVLILGHGAMNSAIICQLWGLSIDRFWSAGIENCRLMQLLPVPSVKPGGTV